MKRQTNKRALYESIMRNVSRKVKRSLNENAGSKLYLLTTMYNSYDDMILGELVPRIFTTYQQAVDAWKTEAEDADMQMVLLDNVKKLEHTYDDEIGNFYKDPTNIDLSQIGDVDDLYYLTEIYVE